MTYSDADSESDESENDKMDTNGQPVIKNGNQVYFYPNGRDGMGERLWKCPVFSKLN